MEDVRNVERKKPDQKITYCMIPFEVQEQPKTNLWS